MALSLSAKLYAVEKSKASNAAARHQRRQQHRSPALSKLKALLDKYRQQTPPKKAALGKAVNYALSQCSALTRYVDSGTWPKGNNPAENAIYANDIAALLPLKAL